MFWLNIEYTSATGSHQFLDTCHVLDATAECKTWHYRTQDRTVLGLPGNLGDARGYKCKLAFQYDWETGFFLE